MIIAAIAMYVYVAAKYSWHVARIDRDPDKYLDIESLLLAFTLLPIAFVVIKCDAGDRYEGFKLLPTIPSRPTEWDREQKRLNQERKSADLAVEQARVRTEHRKHLEQRQQELSEILDAEANRLSQEHK